MTQDFRFHPDEALFTTFARNAAVHGQWMLPGALDKTPLSIYASALSLHFTAAEWTDQQIIQVDTQTSEFAARLPNTIASILLIALIYRITCLIYDRRAGLLAGLLAALSPFLIVFSASAFTDVLMVVFMMSALNTSLRNRPGWSGVFLSLSVASKQQGFFYLPLIAVMLWQRPSSRRANLVHFTILFFAGISLLLLWDAARPETSLFTLASVNNNPERFFVQPDELIPRLKTWIQYGKWMLGSGLSTAIILMAAFLGRLSNNRNQHKSPTELLTLIYIGGYLLVHWIVAFNTYDRYLLPIAPLITILAAGNLNRLLFQGRPQRLLVAGIGLFVAVSLLLNAYRASEGEINAGRNDYPRQNDMIQLADFLNQQPLGTIIYDHWLGWELDYYLGAWTDKRRVYYPEPDIMAEDALKNPESAFRYLVAPTEKSLSRWLYAFKIRGFELEAVKVSPEYQVFRITRPSGDAVSGSVLRHPAKSGDEAVS